METNKVKQLFNKNEDSRKLYKSQQLIKKTVHNDCRIYTPDIIEKYKHSSKTIFQATNNNTKTKFMLYDRVFKWYESEENVNLRMEKIYIRAKLGSYSSGGCGIGASLLAGLTASGIFSYMDNYIKKLGPFFLAFYAIMVLCFGVKILINEDKKVEMYNMFLEVLNNLENDKIEK